MKIKPDVIVTHPRAIDFPVWRWNMDRFRFLFNQVFVCFTGLDQKEDYEEFIKKAMLQADITFLDTPQVQGHQDWRDVAINSCLAKSKSEWVWFMEQDFLWKEERFLGQLFSLDDEWEVHGFSDWDITGEALKREHERLHPACLLVSRRLIEMTSNDYSAKQDQGHGDHFGFFTEQILPHAKIKTLAELGFSNRVDYYHLAGLTHNYTLCDLGKYNQLYKMEDFFVYNYFARKVPVEQDSRFLTKSLIAEEALMQMDKLFPFFEKRG